MADQKLMKKRLKVLMLKPENQVCSDCPERQPRWASLIKPPPGAPGGSIGGFCCLECSGSHRRLGVHISFVRSINLDSWKEQEVEFMENGGNAKVNAIFEARLVQSGAQKPTTIADGHTRERFIRDKYERRKYYDESAYHTMAATAAPPQPDAQDISLPAMNPGPPSDAARQRMEERRGRMKKTTSNVSTESADSTTGRAKRNGVKKTGARKPAVAKATAWTPPPSMDLLDMSEPQQPSQAPASEHAQSSQDSQADMFDFLNSNTSSNHIDSMGSSDSVIPGDATNAAQPPANRNASQDIMSLYNTGGAPPPQQQQQQAFNTNSNNPLGNHMSGLMQQMSINNQNGNGNNGMMNQQQQPNNMMNMNYQQQQQQQPMNQQQQMYQQQMMMQQQQRQMMMNQQQQGNQGGGMMNQQGGNQGGGMMNNNNSNNFNNTNSMMSMQQGMPAQQQNNGGGFGAPMGSGPPMSSMQQSNNRRKEPKQPEKQDPFADFGMNAFR